MNNYLKKHIIYLPSCNHIPASATHQPENDDDDQYDDDDGQHDGDDGQHDGDDVQHYDNGNGESMRKGHVCWCKVTRSYLN